MIIVGMDEVGRGCWAGPLVAGAVVLAHSFDSKDCPVVVRDSKKMSARQREATTKWIQMNAAALQLGWVWPAEIDEIGLSASVKLAMERALAGISLGYDRIIIDGNINYFPANVKAVAVVRADDTVPAVSAASIVAKVARDNYMSGLGSAYSGYGFSNHVGYGTLAHIDALKRLGVSDIHRRSYKPIKALLL